MPRIAPVPIDKLTSDCRAILEDGLKTGQYNNNTGELPGWMRILAWNSYVLNAANAQGKAMWRAGMLGDRLKELIRIRSAQVNGCNNCAGAIKEDSVDGEAVACMIDMDLSAFSPREAAALRYVTKFGADHHAVGDADFQSLREHFSPAEIVELIHYSGVMLRLHRMFHVFAVLEDGEPVIPFDERLINVSKADEEQALHAAA
jgi:alkylhydroperoxidase family enzyme